MQLGNRKSILQMKLEKTSLRCKNTKLSTLVSCLGLCSIFYVVFWWEVVLQLQDYVDLSLLTAAHSFSSSAVFH